MVVSTMTAPTVSIIVPVYNAEKYVERCARSLFEQTYPNLEFIFVDDCSPDNSIAKLQKVTEEYPERKIQTKIILHETNKGPAEARETGIQNATGKYLLFIDSDDWLDLDAVDKLTRAAEENYADIVVYHMALHKPNNVTVFDIQRIPADKNAYICAVLEQKLMVCLCGKMFAADLFKNNKFVHIERCTYYEDLLIFAQVLVFANKIISYPACFYHYDKTNVQSSSFCPKENAVTDFGAVLDVLHEIFDQQNDNFKKSLEQGEVFGYLGMLKNLCASKVKDQITRSRYYLLCLRAIAKSLFRQMLGGN